MTASLISQFLPVLSERYLVDENILVPELLARCDTLQPHQAAAERLATQIVEGIRAQKPRSMDINQLLVAYQLTSEEGIALMCVAEALLRFPDTQTRNALIRDNMSVTEWEASSAANPFQNFSTWALNLTGNVLHLQNKDSGWGVFGKLIARLG